MKSLLTKELRLAASPLSYLFLAFTVMAFIPGYPILVGSFFVCLGMFQSFQSSREQNDILYTVLLPVDKRDAVRAKYAFVCFLELLALVLTAAMTVLRMAFLADAAIYVNNAMMNANLVYIGWWAVVFALFNGVFLGGFFRTAYKFGKPFVTFIVLAMLVVLAGEVLHHIPGLEWVNGTDRLGMQACILAAGLALYAGITAISLRASCRRFEALDL